MKHLVIAGLVFSSISSVCHSAGLAPDLVSNPVIKFSSTTPWPWNPLSKEEILRNYHTFSLDLMNKREISQVDTIAYSPFSVGYTLAVLNEKVILNVSTTGIDSVLKTAPHKIAKSYETLLGLLKDDPDISTVSRIYTPQRKNVLLTVGLGKLNTEVNLIDTGMNSEKVVEFVNAEVSKHLKNDSVIGNKFFPTGIQENILGFLANTFRYKSKWGVSWSPGLERSFESFYTSNSLPYMGTSGNIPLYEDDKFQILKIWMSSRRKYLLLVKPRMHVKELSNSISSVWEEFVTKAYSLKASDFSDTVVLDIKIPRFEATSAASHSSELKDLGLNDTICSKNRHYYRGIRVGQLGQLSRIQLSLPYFEFASITGLKGTQRFYQTTDRRVHVKVQARPERNAVTSVEHASPAKGDSDKNEREVTFDKPFFWAFQDDILGPLALGAVIHPSRKNSEISSTFMDMFLECN